MFYSVDRSGLYQTGGTLDLWQQDPVLGRPFLRLPDWFEAADLRAHVAELFPDGLSTWTPVRVLSPVLTLHGQWLGPRPSDRSPERRHSVGLLCRERQADPDHGCHQWHWVGGGRSARRTRREPR